jgi:hypothetical protein
MGRIGICQIICNLIDRLIPIFVRSVKSSGGTPRRIIFPPVRDFPRPRAWFASGRDR